MGVCYCSTFCCTLPYVHSSIALILMGKRELVALLNLSSWCLMMVEWLFLAVSWRCLRFVIVVFPYHTHLLFYSTCKSITSIEPNYSGIMVIQMSMCRNYLVFQRQFTISNFFTIIYCINTADFWNFVFSKRLNFRKTFFGRNKKCVKMLYKIWHSAVNIKVIHGDHDFLMSASSIVTHPSHFI